ncbi:MAG: hypothetical protein ABFE13_11260 [Phycisphaerales bacterium]
MMKRLLLVGLLLMMLCGAGCVIIDVDEGYSCKPAPTEPQEVMSCDEGAVVCTDVHAEGLLLP